MLRNSTKRQTDTVSFTKRRKKRTGPINKIRTSRTTRKSRRRLFRITRSNHGEKRQNNEIALDARKLNDSCVKRRTHMPNTEELLNQISAELSKNDRNPIWISVIDLDYAYRQMKLAPETSKHCNFAITGEKINSYFRFLKRFFGPADIPTIFQEKMDITLCHQTSI